MEVDSVPQQAVQDIGQIDRADLVVGIVADLSQEDVAEVCCALRTLPGSPRIVVLQNRLAPDTTSTGSAAPAQDSISLDRKSVV